MPTVHKNKCFRPFESRMMKNAPTRRVALRRSRTLEWPVRGAKGPSKTASRAGSAGHKSVFRRQPKRQLLCDGENLCRVGGSRKMKPESAKRTLNGEGVLSQGRPVRPAGEFRPSRSFSLPRTQPRSCDSTLIAPTSGSFDPAALRRVGLRSFGLGVLRTARPRNWNSDA
jgi:hypothetical protein